MLKEEIYYSSYEGDKKIRAMIYSNEENKDIKGIIQIVHGMSEYIDRYEKFAEFLTNNGYVVVGNDHIGHGKSELTNPVFFYEEEGHKKVLQDMHRLHMYITEKYSGVPFVLFGHSMGSFLARNYVYEFGENIDGLILSGSGYNKFTFSTYSQKLLIQFLKLFKGPKSPAYFVDNLAKKKFNKKIKESNSPSDWLSRDLNVGKNYTNDEKCGMIFSYQAYADLMSAIVDSYRKDWYLKVNKKLPIYIFSGSEDALGNYGKDIQRFSERLENENFVNVKCDIYEGGRHEMLNELNKEEVYDNVLSWLENILVK